MGVGERLSEEEIKLAAALLLRATPVPRMEYPILRAVWDARLLPMIPIELLVLDRSIMDARGDHRVLLIYRDDQDFPDCWHHPGGYLGANETVGAAVERITLKEFGASVQEIRAASRSNLWNLSRDHEFAQHMVCVLPEGKISEVEERGRGRFRFFGFNEIPETLLPHHKLIQAKLEEYIRFVLCLSYGAREDFFRLTEIVESDARI